MPGGNANSLLTIRPPRARISVETGILLTVALGAMLVPLNSTMIAVALPRLISDFHTRLTSAGWLVTGYLIAMASLQPVAGKLGDRIGRRPLVLGVSASSRAPCRLRPRWVRSWPASCSQ